MLPTVPPVHGDAIVIDLCSFFFEGYSQQMERGRPTALLVTAADVEASFGEVVDSLELHHRQVEADPDRLLLIAGPEDIPRAKTSGRVGIILGLQNSGFIGSRLHRVRALWRLGVRVLQLTYNERNPFGDGCLEPTDAGLSRLGRSAIREMNEVGVVVDLAHAGQRTALEAIEASELPCIVSHANPRRLAPNPRNLTDEVIRAVADSGGLVGVCGWGPICWRGGPSRPTMEDLVAHIEYIVELVGIDHVGVGLDSPASSSPRLFQHAADINTAYPEVVGGFVAQFGQTLDGRYAVSLGELPGLTQALLDRGFPEAHVRQILGLNALRVFQAVWKRS
jgi:membrane dipeptidase